LIAEPGGNCLPGSSGEMLSWQWASHSTCAMGGVACCCDSCSQTMVVI